MHRRRDRHIRIEAVTLGTSAALVLALATPAAAQRRWVPTELGTPAGLNTVATAVNNAGQVVGYSYPSGGGTRAVLWTPTGMVDLGTLGGAQSGATDINDAGQVVGWSETASGPYHAFLWTAAMGMLDLGPGEATAINAGGFVVGSTSDRRDPFSWTWATGRVALPITCPTEVPCRITPTGVNSRGHVVASVSWSAHIEDSHARAVLWTPDGGTVEIYGDSSAAYDINDVDQVLGARGFSQPFVWTAASGFVDWEERYAVPQAINNVGRVAGAREYNFRTAFTWTREEGVVFLGRLRNGLWSAATDINDAAEIAGYVDVVDPDPAPTPQFLPKQRKHAVLWRQRDAAADAVPTDIAVFRPADGIWYVLQAAAGFATAFGVQWGNSLDTPVPGDYDGDGRTDMAVFRPSDGIWYLLKSSTGFTAGAGYVWGAGTDTPVPGDYDGDGATDIAFFRPSTGKWSFLLSYTGFTRGNEDLFQWGNGSDIPVPSDYDGDGKADVAVFRPSDGVWYIIGSASEPKGYQWGSGGDIPITGDYDGDGRTDLTVFRPSTGTWYIMTSSTKYTAAKAYEWGNSSDVPVAGDYDGDARTDIAVFRPSNGTWYILKSSTDFTAGVAYQWGNGDDIPLPRHPSLP